MLEDSSFSRRSVVTAVPLSTLFRFSIRRTNMVTPRPILVWLIFTTAILSVAARAPPTSSSAPCLDAFCPSGLGPSPCSSLPIAPRAHSTSAPSNSSVSSSSTSRSTSTSDSSTTLTSASTTTTAQKTSIQPSSPVTTQTSAPTKPGTTQTSTLLAFAANVPSSGTSGDSLVTSSQGLPKSRGSTSSPAVAPPSIQGGNSSSSTTDSSSPSSSTTNPSAFSQTSSSPTSSVLFTPPTSSQQSVPPTTPQPHPGQTAMTTAGASSTSVAPVASTPSTAPQEKPSSSQGKISTGAIIGTIVSILGVFWLAALALWWLLRKWREAKVQATRTGGPAWRFGAHGYEHANEAPDHGDTTSSDPLQPASHQAYDEPPAGFGGSDKEAKLLASDSSPAPPSRPPTPLPDQERPMTSRCHSESPATLVERPNSLAPSRPESIRNTELLALAWTDYSVAVSRARARSASAPGPRPLPTTSMSMPEPLHMHTAFGAELTRTSTNPFRARLHAAEVARKNSHPNLRQVPSLGDDDDRDWWVGQRA